MDIVESRSKLGAARVGSLFVAGLSFVVAAVLLVSSVRSVRADHKAEFTTRSYYITTGNAATLEHLGCEGAQKKMNGRLILYFGAPTSVSGTYGNTIWGGPNQTIAQVEELAKAYMRGFWNCNQGTSALVGFGTSNSTIDGKTNAWIRAHGREWGRMINRLHTWKNNNGWESRISVYGAYDAEPSWSTFQKANLWMHGYEYDAPFTRPLYANYSADGCPQNSATNGGCNNGWSQFRLYHLAWWHKPAMPLPQIYTNNGSQAKQWQKISEYGHHKQAKGRLTFFGVMAQKLACGNGCPGTNNTAHDAMSQMFKVTNGHPHTANTVHNWATDITWSLHHH